jgi:glycosyltransferase involved in cell wall biosynthesis
MMRNNYKISVIICTLNEEKNLYHVLPHIPDFVNEVVLVDGGSTDRTIETAERLYPKIRVIHQYNKGKGDALRMGIFLSTGDIAVTLDADGATDPKEMERFIEPLLDGYDFAKGTRFMFGYPNHKVRHRKLGNWIIIKVFNLLFRKHYTDLCSGYNAFWRVKVRNALCPWSQDSFENEPFINARVAKKGLKVMEVPHTEMPRFSGKLKEASWRQGTKAIKSIVRERLLG